MNVISEIIQEHTSQNETNTQALAATLSVKVIPGDCILLIGDLGSGKTTFARSVITTLNKDITNVPSPTYTLLQTYPILTDQGEGCLAHVDLYRLEHVSELEELGLDEYLNDGITLIEWPEIARHQLPANNLTITFECLPNGDRLIQYYGNTDWKKRIDNT